jgi:microcystin-dependent protein
MPAIPLNVTRGKTFGTGPVTAADLNQAAAPLVEIPEGADIGPENLDMPAVAAAISGSSRPVNWVPNPAFVPGFWRAPAGVAVAAGSRRENARSWEVAPSGGAVQYLQDATTPDSGSSASLKVSGGSGVTSADVGFYLDPDSAGQLRGEPSLCFSAWVFNGGGAQWAPSLIIQPSAVAGVPGGGAETVLVHGSQLPLAQWQRCSWIVPASTITNWDRGVRLSIRVPGAVLDNSAKFLLLSQVQLEIGAAATSFMRVPVPLSADPFPVGSTQLWFGQQPLSGWLWCDGAEYLQADYPQLYSLLGTRYGSASAGAFRVPDVRENLLAGPGVMPGSSVPAPGRLQVTVSGCTVVVGSALVTVPDRSRIAPGMRAFGPGIPTGAVVTAMAGTSSVRISAPATASASPADLRFARTLVDPSASTGAAASASGGQQPRRWRQVAGVATTSGSVDITLPATAAETIQTGSSVTGPGIPAGATVVAQKSATVLVLSAGATATAAAATLQFAPPPVPSALVLQSCSVNATTTVTVPASAAIRPGMLVAGTLIPAGAYVVSVTNATTIVISAAAVGTGTGQSLSFESETDVDQSGPDTLLPVLAVPLIIKAI